jgi:hypothetical protein
VDVAALVTTEVYVRGGASRPNGEQSLTRASTRTTDLGKQFLGFIA